MSLKAIDIKMSYETNTDDLIEDFYIPVLKESVQYDRLAGFFSSASLAIASRGIAGLIENSGKIRILASPRLSEEDVKAIETAIDDPTFYLTKSMLRDIEESEDEFFEDHLGALGWMIAHGNLEIKVALLLDEDGKILSDNSIAQKGIFHQKVGIFTDKEGNVISFSGSINETAKGWVNNVEEFKVFKRWEPGQEDYCNTDISKFESYWLGKNRFVQIFDIPEAVSKRLIQKSKKDPIEALSIQNYRSHIRKSEISISLFPFQKEAIKKWNENNRRLICEMATGTGKTRIALGCVDLVIKENIPFVTIIACPQNTLSRQWKDEVLKNRINFHDEIITDSTNPSWKLSLPDKLMNISLGIQKNLVIYATHDTCCSDDFIDILQKNKRAIIYFFIGDEAHGLGAVQTSRALQDFYDYRLGLSATPKRWYDDFGTKFIYDFFGNVPFEFSIKQALNTINPLTNRPFLCNYYYYPVFVTLNDEELEDYSELSKKISKLYKFGIDDQDRKAIFENLLFRRAKIHKNAINKREAFENILETIEEIEDLLVFVCPEQMRYVLKLFASKGIVANRFTEKEGTQEEAKFGGRTQRQFLIDKFKEKKIKALVAIKCLDEGIDIPSAKRAILLASSSNPREFIQRIGRVIRQSPNKNFAEIYDIIVCPDSNRLTGDFKQFELKVFEKEMNRALEIAENAQNNAYATQRIFSALKGERNDD